MVGGSIAFAVFFILALLFFIKLIRDHNKEKKYGKKGTKIKEWWKE